MITDVLVVSRTIIIRDKKMYSATESALIPRAQHVQGQTRSECIKDDVLTLVTWETSSIKGNDLSPESNMLHIKFDQAGLANWLLRYSSSKV